MEGIVTLNPLFERLVEDEYKVVIREEVGTPELQVTPGIVVEALCCKNTMLLRPIAVVEANVDETAGVELPSVNWPLEPAPKATKAYGIVELAPLEADTELKPLNWLA